MYRKIERTFLAVMTAFKMDFFIVNCSAHKVNIYSSVQCIKWLCQHLVLMNQNLPLPDSVISQPREEFHFSGNQPQLSQKKGKNFNHKVHCRRSYLYYLTDIQFKKQYKEATLFLTGFRQSKTKPAKHALEDPSHSTIIIASHKVQLR